MNHAVIVNDQIVNVIVWDGEASYAPLAGGEVALLSTLPNGAGVGWTRDAGGIWQAPLAPEPDPSPVVWVSPLQARRALAQAGLRQAVEDWVAAQPQDVRDAWDYATQIRRDDPLIVAAGAALSLTQAQVDELFVLAETL